MGIQAVRHSRQPVVELQASSGRSVSITSTCFCVMAIVLDKQHLPHLLATLKNIQSAYQIRGELLSKLHSVITDYDFIVDRWPDYTALVVRADPATAKHPVFLGNRTHVYTTDRDALEVMLQQPGVVQWSDKTAFSCLGADVLSTVTNVICQNDRTYDLDSYVVMKVTKDTLKLRNISKGYTMTSLHPEDAYHVNTRWSYNDGGHSETYIRDLISKQPSRCLYNDEGSLIGYALRLQNGTLGFLYVLEEHRGKGYAKVIMSHLASLCLQQMEEVYVHVHRNNIASICVHKNIGFHCPSNLGPLWWIQSQGSTSRRSIV
ncbi:glycine N-acyltransferase-like [Haliotis asinina]|uniref:glycine N-acyltransferase-like n=1 Tax=Haliotis asinina TaxID=109174 RepID=UPI003531C2E9